MQRESETPMPGVTDTVGYHNAYPQTAVLPFSFRVTSSQSMCIIYVLLIVITDMEAPFLCTTILS